MKHMTLPLASLLLLGTQCAAVHAQEMKPSFALIGEIENFKLDSSDIGPLPRATMTVSGIEVVLPSSLLITMPGRYASAKELFDERIDTTQSESGLALADPHPPFTAFEAELTGNIVDGKYIAGIARISQGALHTGAGFIQHIDYKTGELRIGIPNGTKGARIVLNDETGVFGLSNAERDQNDGSPNNLFQMDPRFKLDDANAPVHAKTGYPVCIPRVDPAVGGDAKCPASNRPAGLERNRFTCTDHGAAAAADVPAHVTCKPKLPVPLVEGDYVTYSGILQKLPDGTFRTAVYGLDAEIGIYTSPGVDPVYVLIEEALQGTKGERFPNIPQEETTRFRIVGFTTDPSRDVEVKIVDSDRPEHEFKFDSLTPDNLFPLGRFRNTWPSKENARAVRRDVQVSVVDSAHEKLTNGLTSGVYTAPIGEYIYPEITRFGVPGYPSPVSFENFCFLTNAGGKYPDPATGPSLLAKLDPFPESGHAQSQEIGAGTERVCNNQ